MKKIWQKIKSHWEIDSDIQAVIILVVFALTGFSTLYAHNFIDFVLGIDGGTSFWIKLLVFVLLVLPIFNLFLIVWGTLLGQGKFFKNFIKTKIRLLTKWKKDKSVK